MKKRLVVGMVALSAMVFGVTGAYAGSQIEKITAYFNHDIKFTVDHKEWQPKDPDGNELSPIIYNGSSYLPARALSEAVGAGINWDEATKTIHITKKVEGEDPHAGIPFKDSVSYTPVKEEALLQPTTEVKEELVDLGIVGIETVFETTYKSANNQTIFSGNFKDVAKDTADSVKFTDIKLTSMEIYSEKHAAMATYTATKVEVEKGKTTTTTTETYSVYMVSEKGYVVISSIEAH